MKGEEKTMKIKTYYKLARPDGWDFYTGETINYRENIGKVVSIPDEGYYILCSDLVIHASLNPNDCFVGASIPCSAYEVEGNPVIETSEKCGFVKLRVVKEILDLDSLFGWKYSEVINPINPLKIKANKVTKKEISLVKEWDSVWDFLKASVFGSAWGSVCASVWDSISYTLGTCIRDIVWLSVVNSLGDSVSDNIEDGIVSAYIGSLFPKIRKWKYFQNKKSYPFQPVAELWEKGFIPNFDGKIWRLYAGMKKEIVWKAKIVWEETL